MNENKTKILHKNKVFLIILLVAVLLLGVVYFSWKYFSLAHSSSHLTTKNSVAETPLEVYPEKLLWVAYNQKYQGLEFSTEIPFPGPYCDCYDSTGGLADGVSLDQVEGGFFTDWIPFAKRKCLVVSSTFSFVPFLA